jgi:hypothetical protein
MPGPTVTVATPSVSVTAVPRRWWDLCLIPGSDFGCVCMLVQIEAVLKTAGDLSNVHGALTGHFKSSAGEHVSHLAVRSGRCVSHVLC